MKKTLFVFSLLLVLLAGAQSVGAQAELALSLSGYAWSSNIGWVKFRDLTTLGQPFGVDLLPVSGGYRYFGYYGGGQNLPGYVWSNNIGWIKFDPNPNFTGPPGATDTHGARIAADGSGSIANGEYVTGWARACSVLASSDCSGTTMKSNDERGGWDGWIKMSGLRNAGGGVPAPGGGGQQLEDPGSGGEPGGAFLQPIKRLLGWLIGNNQAVAQSTPDYGVQKMTVGSGSSAQQILKGYAWGGEVVGWLHLSPDLPGPCPEPPCDVVINQVTLSCAAARNDDPSTPLVYETDWTLSASGGTGTTYKYCWGDRCTPGLGGDVDAGPEDRPHEVSWTTQIDFTSPGQKFGYGKVTDVLENGDPAGVTRCDKNLVIPPFGAPTVDLTADPTSLPPGGGDTDLTWTPTGVFDSCVASDDSNPVPGLWTGPKAPGGGTETLALTVDGIYIFRINCTGPAGSDDDDAVVTVGLDVPDLRPVGGRDEIRLFSQLVGRPALSTIGQITNAGGGVADASLESIITLVSPMPGGPSVSGSLINVGGLYDSSDPFLSGIDEQELPKCRMWLTTETPPDFNSILPGCTDPNSSRQISGGQIANFQIQVRAPFQRLNFNSPYQVKISEPGGTSAVLRFRYEVGGTIPF